MKQNNNIRGEILKNCNKPVIGITGGTGSGKSTVSDMLSDMGGFVINADSVYKNLLENNQEMNTEIIDAFGEIISAEGNQKKVDRIKLGKIAFSDKERLNKLSEITHPFVIKEMYLTVIPEEAWFVVLDVPVPVKEGFLDIANQIWVVVSEDEIRMNRLVKRNNLDIKQVLRRMELQLTKEEYLGLADRIIYNNSGIEDLLLQVKTALSDFKEVINTTAKNYHLKNNA